MAAAVVRCSDYRLRRWLVACTQNTCDGSPSLSLASGLVNGLSENVVVLSKVLQLSRLFDIYFVRISLSEISVKAFETHVILRVPLSDQS